MNIFHPERAGNLTCYDTKRKVIVEISYVDVFKINVLNLRAIESSFGDTALLESRVADRVAVAVKHTSKVVKQRGNGCRIFASNFVTRGRFRTTIHRVRKFSRRRNVSLVPNTGKSTKVKVCTQLYGLTREIFVLCLASDQEPVLNVHDYVFRFEIIIAEIDRSLFCANRDHSRGNHRQKHNENNDQR